MPANPYQVLYWNPSLPVVKFAKMAQKFHNARELEILQRCAALAGYVLAPAGALNWRQKQKWKEASFRVGREVYYFLAPEQAARLKLGEAEKIGEVEKKDVCQNLSKL